MTMNLDLNPLIQFAEWSAAQKIEGAIIMWSRSINLYQSRYTEMLSDGYSKSYKALIDCNLYEGVSISKIEFTNHVTKRMGTALCKLVATQRSNKQPICKKES